MHGENLAVYSTARIARMNTLASHHSSMAFLVSGAVLSGNDAPGLYQGSPGV